MKKAFNKKSVLRLAAVALLCATLCLSFSGCSNKEDDGEIDIICTIFPLYDWVRSIVGDSENVNVRLMVKSGADMHSFQPSFEDVADIKTADAVIYVGGESDDWVGESIPKDGRGIKLTRLSDIRLYEVSDEYIAQANAHENEKSTENHNHSISFDEHLWLSVNNARVACNAICELLCELDGDNAQKYRDNLSAYIQQLDTLDASLSELGEYADTPLIFADRFPFAYLFEDYGISYYAAFEGCSADASADFETVIRLAKKADELNSSFILTTESSNGQLARSVVEATADKNAEILSLDSMQSVSGKDTETASYVKIMESNIATLQRILKTKE